MHSKSDNLGYLKDQNNVKFSGGFTPWPPTLDPLGRAQGNPPPPNPPALRCLLRLLLHIYLFSGLTLRVWWHVCIPVMFLKNCDPELSFILAELFN